MVTYRLANTDDYEHINNFHNRIYKKNRTINQFLWEFNNGPFGKSIYVIANDGDKIVGTNCVIPIVLTNSKNEFFLTGKSEDTLVDPEYRGQNIFNNIYDYLFQQCAKNGIKYIWGFTSAKKPFQKIGFQVPFEHQQSLIVNDILESYRFISALNHNNKLKQKIQILGLCILSKLKSLKGSLNTNKSSFKITVDINITDQVNHLIEASCKNNPGLFYIFQNEKFQQWRIYDNPNFHKVHTYGAYDSNNKLINTRWINKPELTYVQPNSIEYDVFQYVCRPLLEEKDKESVTET
jgi:N-acetylglutamate synthase-like GNAT family acetyltransferase